MAGYADLHSHWIPDIDDGVRTVDDGIALLRGLGSVGFELVVATPHMRPGMFDNDRASILAGYEAMRTRLASEVGLPAVDLASEHYFDDIVYKRLLAGEGLLYPGGHAVLIELSPDIFPVRLGEAFFELRRKAIRPVLAHPERYTPVSDKITILDSLCDGGTLLLLDLCSLVGKYGKKPQRAAEELLTGGYYYAACTDAHRPRDVEVVVDAIERLVSLMGKEEAEFLLGQGPRNILSGKVES